MGKITSYPAARKFDSGVDVILKDGTNGTKKMTVSDLSLELMNLYTYGSAKRRRNMYKVENLGTSFTSEHNAALSSDGGVPSFNGMYVGSYWTINGHRYDIADFDYWYDKYDTLDGNNSENVHHVVLIPKFTSTSKAMNDTDTTEGAYLGSKMYIENMAAVRQIIEEDWGSHIVTHREVFSNAVTNGVPSAHIWVDSRIDLMNELMVYGHYAFSPFPINTYNHDHYTIDRDQLAIFRLNPAFIRSCNGWLRDVASDSVFAHVHAGGDANAHKASGLYNVRPAFAIKAT